MDYGRFKYKASKRLHEAKKKQIKSVVKEIKLRPKTEEHDFQFKNKHAHQFLTDGNKVKVTILFRGREVAYRDIGLNLLKRFSENLEDIGMIESPVKSEGRTAFMILAPSKATKGP